MAAAIILDSKPGEQPTDGGEDADRSMLRTDSGSGEDSMDGLSNRVPCCPLTPSLSPRKRTTSQSKTEPPLLRTNKRTIYTAGRPPWYNVTGTTFKEAFVIGVKLQAFRVGVLRKPHTFLNRRISVFFTLSFRIDKLKNLCHAQTFFSTDVSLANRNLMVSFCMSLYGDTSC
ncbi:uridine-cytidine kinase-like 1 isoform X1 [Poecilia latipinna]|uniref:uridine-cytidine kinase-like 1 isoform X1 n=1 Tax=Poecilia latipinna TaxID=48699 RepID=UPI00072DB6B2|nr:PREDICTED: uridine-cytidine kinase-like 1 isoform X1 [Poecilia latipinna]